MAKVIYNPPKGEDETTEQFGYAFEKGKPVNVTDEKCLSKFRGNAAFSVEDDKK